MLTPASGPPPPAAGAPGAAPAGERSDGRLRHAEPARHLAVVGLRSGATRCELGAGAPQPRDEHPVLMAVGLVGAVARAQTGRPELPEPSGGPELPEAVPHLGRGRPAAGRVGQLLAHGEIGSDRAMRPAQRPNQPGPNLVARVQPTGHGGIWALRPAGGADLGSRAPVRASGKRRATHSPASEPRRRARSTGGESDSGTLPRPSGRGRGPRGPLL